MREREMDERVTNTNAQTSGQEQSDNWDEIVQSVIAEIEDPQEYLDRHRQEAQGQ